MRRERLARKKLIRFLRLIALTLFLAVVVIFFTIRQEGPIISPLSTSVLSSDLPIQDTKAASYLGNVISEELKDAKGEYAIVVSNLKTQESYSLNEHEAFDAGSLYKLWVMAGTIEKIKSGRLEKEKVLSEDVQFLNERFNLSTESAELKEGKITLPVFEALRRMIVVSDNYSALLLAWNLRLSNVAAYLNSKGFFESKLGTANTLPTTTAYDIALFFERLYKGNLSDKEGTEEMITLLKGQKLNNKIPKYLPKDTVIAHKTGELAKVSHDAGIIYHPKGEYIFVIMSESARPVDAEERIAKISKAVYDYFDKR